MRDRPPTPRGCADSIQARAGVLDRRTGFTLRTVAPIVRLERHVEQCMCRHAKVGISPLHDDTHPGDLRAMFAHDVDDLAHRKAGRHDVFDDERAILRRQAEASAQRRSTVLLLHKDRIGPKLTRNFVAEHNAADRGADHDRWLDGAEGTGDVFGYGFDEPGTFENTKLLNEGIAVPSGTQAKVSA